MTLATDVTSLFPARVGAMARVVSRNANTGLQGSIVLERTDSTN